MSYPITFGKYLLLERINVGGMAEVFKARSFGAENFSRMLAIKRILPNMVEDEEFINMFIDEARIAVQLNHVNIVQIYELGKFETQFYIAMEYVAGKDLRQILDYYHQQQKTMPVAAAAYIAAKICDGLDYAHRKADVSGKPLQLIHRDVSPQNILLSYEGAVKITDFGIAKAEDRASKTQAGVLKGKFGYMSPEQVRGLEIDRRSDIFALGILLYEMLTGQRLFIGESDFSTLEKVRHAEVVPPSKFNAEISPELERVMLKALAKERDERYQWALELHDDLQQFLITDNTVFHANRLGSILQQEFATAFATDMQKLAEYAQLPPPATADAIAAAASMRAAPTADWLTNGNERTMIFEKGLDIDTQVPTILESRPIVVADPQVAESPTQPIDIAAPLMSMTTEPEMRRGWSKWWYVGLSGLLLVTGLLGLRLFKHPAGTLIITSSPTDTVDIYIDDTLVGQKTPMIKPNIPTGEHKLVAKAPGYQERAYRFDLVSGAPAEIKVELESINEAGNPAAAVLEITSDPPMASVKVQGLPQGMTNLHVPIVDKSQPVLVDIDKLGYVSQQATVLFGPHETSKTIHVALLMSNPNVNLEPLPKDIVPAKLTVHSRPAGAALTLSGIEQGVTPVEVGNLDPRQSYVVLLEKEGFYPYTQTVNLHGRTAVVFKATLRPMKRRGSKVALAAVDTSCTGNAGQISVMSVGHADCEVFVGQMSLGVAPVFKKSSPSGRCSVRVKCPDGKSFETTMQLRPGVEQKLIIKAEDWH